MSCFIKKSCICGIYCFLISMPMVAADRRADSHNDYKQALKRFEGDIVLALPAQKADRACSVLKAWRANLTRLQTCAGEEKVLLTADDLSQYTFLSKIIDYLLPIHDYYNKKSPKNFPFDPYTIVRVLARVSSIPPEIDPQLKGIYTVFQAQPNFGNSTYGRKLAISQLKTSHFGALPTREFSKNVCHLAEGGHVVLLQKLFVSNVLKANMKNLEPCLVAAIKGRSRDAIVALLDLMKPVLLKKLSDEEKCLKLHHRILES